uniref:Uncharacterized protein n=1 Tax=Tanacetum cinerariifolium TaxID=118510 RepID=A0A699H140_TANCI|nr:hypothetical protein [Tanacetum cinerariifolium]
MKVIKIAKIFRIGTNIFDFETHLCKEIMEFNHLLQIDIDVLTRDLPGLRHMKIIKMHGSTNGIINCHGLMKNHGWKIGFERNLVMVYVMNANRFNSKVDMLNVSLVIREKMDIVMEEINLECKHKFHPRADSPLHLPYEEYVLRYLKFSAKGTNQKVAKHQRYLVGEEGSDPDSPAPKPAKATKPKETTQSMPSVPKAAPVIKATTAKASKSTSSQKPKPAPLAPKSTPVKPQEKKQRLVKETSDEPSPAKRSKPGFIGVYFHQWSLENPTLGDVNHFQRFREREREDLVGPSIYHEDEKATRADVETDTEELLTHTKKSGEEMSNTVGSLYAYHNVQENLKLTVEEHDILEEPASCTGTLSSLQHLARGFSFGDQFFNDKPSEAENEKTTAKTKVESMVHSSGDEDIGNDHISKVNLMQDWWKPLSEEDRPATSEPAWSIPSFDLPTADMATFMDWYCKQQEITELKQEYLEGPAFEIVKVFQTNVIHL